MSIRNDLVLITSRSAILPASEESSRKERITISGGDRYVIDFDNSGDNQAIFTIAEFPANYQNGTLSLEVLGFMETDTSGSVVLNAYVEAITPGDSLDLVNNDSFDSVNIVTTSVPSSVGYLFSSTITLTNADSVQSGDHIRIKLVRDIGTATGNYKLLSVKIYENLTTLDFSNVTSTSFSAVSASGAITSTVATGTAPFTISSTTRVANLNVDMIDGLDSTAFPILAPGSSSRNVIQPTGASFIPLVCKGFTSQSAALQQWQNSGGTSLASVSAAGLISALSFTSTQTTGTAPFVVASTTLVTNLNADSVDNLHATNFPILAPTSSTRNLIQPTGAGFIPLVCRGFTSQSAALQQWQNSAGTSLASVSAAGLISALSFTSTQTTGTAPFVVASTTLVTNLNADTIDGLDSTAFPILAPDSSSRNVIQPTEAGFIPLICRGYTSQSVNIQEWQISSSAKQLAVSKDGYLSFYENSGANLLGQIVPNSSNGQVAYVIANPGYPGFAIKAATSQSANIQEWQASDGDIRAYVNYNGDFYCNRGITADQYSGIHCGTTEIFGSQIKKGGGDTGNRVAIIGVETTAYNATTIPLVAKGYTSQSVALQQWKDDSDNVLSSVDAKGNINIHQTVLTYGATTDINFNDGGMRVLDLTGDITFTTSNRAANKSVCIKITSDSSTRSFTFPSWVFIGSGAPTSIAANKTAILTITCYGTADTDVVAAYAVDGGGASVGDADTLDGYDSTDFVLADSIYANKPIYDAGNVSSSTYTYNYENSRVQKIICGANIEFSFANAIDTPAIFHIDNTGGYTLTFNVAHTLKWPSGTPFNLDHDYNILTIVYNSIDGYYYMSAVGDFS
jgi:hypothetical protein